MCCICLSGDPRDQGTSLLGNPLNTTNNNRVRLKQKIGGRRVKSWPNVASKKLQSRKKYNKNVKTLLAKQIFFHPYLRQAAKIYVSTSYSVVRQETIEISEQRTAFV